MGRGSEDLVFFGERETRVREVRDLALARQRQGWERVLASVQCGHMLALMNGLRGRSILVVDFSPDVPVRSYSFN